MGEIVLKRMEQELKGYQEYLVSGKMTAEQIVNHAHQFIVKRGIYYVFDNYNHGKLSAVEWEWLGKQEHPLDYLYKLWIRNDMDLTEVFAEIIHNELGLDMEVHTNE